VTGVQTCALPIYTDTSGGSTTDGGSNSNLSSGDANDFNIINNILGTFDDVLASGNFNLANMDGLNEEAIKAAMDNYTTEFFNAEDFSKENFYKSLWTESTIGTDGVETLTTNYFNKYIWDEEFNSNTDIKLNTLLGDEYRDIDEYAAANGDAAAGVLLDQAITLAQVDEIANEIGNISLDTTFSFGG